MKIAILGGGIYGSVLASYFEGLGHEVCIDEVAETEAIFVCTTSNLVLSTLLKFEKDINDQKIIICSKGFTDTGKLISEVLKEEFKKQNQIYFLYGPNLADEIEQGVPSGMVLAGGKGREEIKKAIESEKLSVQTSDDVIGVEISATLKNTMTMFIGIIEGARYGQNTQALIFSKSLQEMKEIGLALGAKTETFLGLSAVGDLYLKSRNRIFGIELGKGKKPEEISSKTGHTPAGLFDLKSAKILSERLNVNAPVIRAVNKIVFEDYPVAKALEDIMKS